MRIVQTLTLDGAFARFLRDALDADTSTRLVGFDVLTDPERSPASDRVALDRPPFGILDDSARSPEGVAEFMNEFASAWTTVLLVVKDSASIRTAGELADRTLLFAIGAYDGESYVFWRAG